MSWEADANNILRSYIPENKEDYTQPLLLALIEHAPTSSGRRNICTDILQCRDDKENDLDTRLRALGKWYETKLFLPLKAGGGKTPKPSEHPSRQPSMDDETILNELLISGMVSHRESTSVKKASLIRDNYRSVMSGIFDVISIRDGRVPDTRYKGPTQAAHILPFSLGNPDAATVLTALEHFSGTSLLVDLCGQNINRLSNILTLTLDEHFYFGELTAWLEATTDDEHTYRIHATSQYHSLPEDSIVQFTTPDAERLPLPDPRYLAIHAACAKVLHASGIGEHIDQVLRDYEELPVLATDGTSNALFEALQRISIQ
ncbi:hypothetical protein RSOL_136530 [Rhizoctonia solani AG-3 Rhs1AP]|uniref:Uncharacterized protein n=1 Tax=Rhizoctonia solani AG-3 Rhs1AP TaxID=1086054 RepID=X8J1J9_9AGAM|nr:hypothetical protein RSOL_136530 [Rhizoctonia solani AG-3 Rhs1AP]